MAKKTKKTEETTEMTAKIEEIKENPVIVVEEKPEEESKKEDTKPEVPKEDNTSTLKKRPRPKKPEIAVTPKPGKTTWTKSDMETFGLGVNLGGILY